MLRNKVIYVALVSYSWILAILYTERQTLIVASLFLIIPIFLSGIRLYQKRSVVVEFRCNSKVCTQKESISFTVKATNSSLLPIGTIRVELLFENEYTRQKKKEAVYLSIDSKSSSYIQSSFISQYSGVLKITVKKAVIYDYLKLTHSKVSCINRETEIAILPEEISLACDLPIQTISELSEGEDFSKRKPGNDPSEVFNIREYIPGDKLQNIHWKLSAKKDAFLVKEYSLPIHCEIGILIDFAMNLKSKSSLKLADGYINITNLLSRNLVQNKQVHFISFLESEEDCMKIMQIQNEEQYYEAIYQLLYIHPYKTQNKVLSYAEMIKNPTSIFRLYYICSNSSVTEAIQLKEMFKRANITIFVLNDSITEEQMQYKETEQLGIKVHTIHYDKIEEDLNSFILE